MPQSLVYLCSLLSPGRVLRTFATVVSQRENICVNNLEQMQKCCIYHHYILKKWRKDFMPCMWTLLFLLLVYLTKGCCNGHRHAPSPSICECFGCLQYYLACFGQPPFHLQDNIFKSFTLTSCGLLIEIVVFVNCIILDGDIFQGYVGVRWGFNIGRL